MNFEAADARHSRERALPAQIQQCCGEEQGGDAAEHADALARPLCVSPKLLISFIISWCC